MTNRGPWKPGISTGKAATIEKAAEQAWENAKKGIAAPGLTAGKALPSTYRLEIWIETENPIHAYIVTLDPTGP
jgi:hypothetical protein